MANKIIKISDISEKIDTLESNEVYLDLSPYSFKNQYKKPSKDDSKYQIYTRLAQEHPGIKKAEDLVLTEEEKNYILLYCGIDEESFQDDFNMFLLKSQYMVTKNVNIKAIQGSLKNIFNWIQGERILLPEFGSKLRKILYEGITQYNIEQIILEIQYCITEWEPRISIKNIVNVGTNNDTEDNTVHLQINYIIPGLSDQIFTYDFYSDKIN